MAGEIKINDVSIATESGGTVTLGNATLGSTVVLGTNASPIASNLVLAAGNGIDFSAASGSAAGSSSAVLDDYEEGTFNVTLTGYSSNPSVTYNTDFTGGRYTKIGNLVHVNLECRWTALSGGGGAAILSLPFTRVNEYKSDSSLLICEVYGQSISTSYDYVIGSVELSTNDLRFKAIDMNGTSSTLVISDLGTSGTCFLRVSGTYQTTS
jgi:hypothetical protein